MEKDNILIKNAIKIKKGYFYEIDQKGNIVEYDNEKKADREIGGRIVKKDVIKRKPLTLYYIDGEGNICTAELVKMD